MSKKKVAKHVFLYTLLLVFGCNFCASGQNTVHKLTLNEAIEISKAQSPDALNAKQTFRKSYWEFRSYKASNLPALGLTSTLPNITQNI